MLVTQRTRRRPGDLRSITAWATHEGPVNNPHRPAVVCDWI